jgi:hypothetical protein
MGKVKELWEAHRIKEIEAANDLGYRDGYAGYEHQNPYYGITNHDLIEAYDEGYDIGCKWRSRNDQKREEPGIRSD